MTRNKNDAYFTPPALTRVLIDRLEASSDWWGPNAEEVGGDLEHRGRPMSVLTPEERKTLGKIGELIAGSAAAQTREEAIDEISGDLVNSDFWRLPGEST